MRIRTVEGKVISLTTALRIIEDRIALRTKGHEGIRVERSRLVTDVVKRVIMQVSVGIKHKELFVSTVKSRVTLLEIARPQKWNRLQM
jgi:hypothetical protein